MTYVRDITEDIMEYDYDLTCRSCGEPLSDDEEVYCKRCEYERKIKRRRRVIVAVCLTAAAGALCYFAYVNRDELKKKSGSARDSIRGAVKDIPIKDGILRVKKAGCFAGDKAKELWVRIDDKFPLRG